MEDSLLNNQLSNSNRIKIHNILAREYSFVNPIKSIENAEMALELSNKMNDLTGVANAYRILGSVYAQNDNYYQGMEFFLSALDIFEDNGDSLGIGNVYTSMGHYYSRLGLIEQQIFYHKKSLEIFRNLGNQARIGIATHNLSETYLVFGKYEECEKLAFESVEINKRVKNRSVLSSCYNVLGRLQVELGNEQLAKEYFYKVLTISEQLGENSQKLATVGALINLANVEESNQNYEAMLNYLLKAIEFSGVSLLSEELADILLKLTSYYVDTGQLDSAKSYGKKYQELLQKKRAKQAEDRYKLISSVEAAHNLQKERDQLEESNLLKESKLQLAYISIILISVIILILIWTLLLNIRKNKILAKQQKTIESQKLRLESLNFTKDKFFGIVAHDIKAPLNNMKALSDLMLSHIDRLEKKEIREMAQMTSNSLKSTIKMADNLISWARLQMGDVAVDQSLVDVGNNLADIVTLFKDIAAKKQIEMLSSFESDLKIIVDPNQLEFIIRNLLNNAVKFTRAHGMIKISGQQENNKVIITVADNGIGMPDEIKENVFKLESKHSMKGTDGEKGTGLGLMLCQEFITLNNGVLTIESKEDQGTVITLTFDAA
ncbi:tetratricopeptide repeat-containing sensor histidine kinase [Marivirga tractuosa]|nr:tetratricopeptide repeat-containing sensor histidine kinase [Marivirga tractuosa]